jgi:branched-chain amino acid transport system permease protein
MTAPRPGVEGRSTLMQDLGSALALVIGTGVLALLSSGYVHGALVLFVLNAILVLSYRTITTMGGWSFAHVAIMGVGAYAVAILSTPPFELPVLLTVAIGGVLAGLVAMLLSWPVLRTRQYYFFLSTFAAGEALRQCFIQFKGITGGTSGIAFIPRPGFIDESAALPFLWLSLGVFLVLAVAAICFDASETGMKIRAVGEDETLSASLGLDAWGLRATAFVLGSVGAGIAGGLLASYNGIVAPNDFGAALMFKIVASCIVGGTRRACGPLLGLIFLTVIEEMFRSVPVYVPLIWGGLVIFVTLYAPGGLESLVERLRHRGRRLADA